MLRIVGGRALIGGRIESAPIRYEGQNIVEDDANAEEFRADGLLVLPGIVDIHGDAFERQIQPRPKVSFPLEMALSETDNQLIANGITTAYHGLTISWEPGLRSIETARTFVAALRAIRSKLACDTKLHIRWETFALDELDEVLGWLEGETNAIFAVNDHTTSMMTGGVQVKKIGTAAARAGLSKDEYEALMKRIWARRDEVPAAIATAAKRVKTKNACLLAHDETSAEQRRYFRELGAVVSEFPMNEATARDARDAGEHTILGAPNVIRGGSHNGALNAADAVLGGYCSVLTSDYYYPAPLHAAFKLVTQHSVRLEDAWALVSRHAAEAAGFADRGELSVGKRADIVLVDDTNPEMPRVVCAFVGGRKVFDRRH